MAVTGELKKIKKKYGENFMKLCRNLFPTLLETEGRLYDILNLSFAGNSRTLYNDIVNNELEEEFKNYIYSKIDVQDSENKVIEEKTPYELLDEAGYELIECSTEEEIQKFKKYYAPGEELCTFNGGRLNRCVVFFAVKKDVEKIKREDFKKPKREDVYGTSVMGIQFNKEGICTVSIKNRYNHRVNNPDATYGNDLDRIILGLTQSFGKLLAERGLELSTSNIEKIEIPGYEVANDGKYYKYNMEIDGDYYCPGNIIIKDGEVDKIENPEKQILIDYFIIDLKNKTIQPYDQTIKDSFTDGLKDIEKIDIITKKDEKAKKIIIQKKEQEQPIIIKIDKDNQIIGYENTGLTQIENCFLCDNYSLTQLNIPNVEQIGDHFLSSNQALTQLTLPNLKEIRESFLVSNVVLTELNIPNVKQVGDNFLFNNEKLTQLNIPNVEQIGEQFLCSNQGLTQLEMPKAKQIGDKFLTRNEDLTQLDMPNLEQVGDGFLTSNEGLAQLNIPNIKQVGNNFLFNNEKLTQINIPNLEQVGDSFLYSNEELTQLNMPNLEQVGNYFLRNNKVITQSYIPKIKQVGDYFLYNNIGLTQLDMPNVEQVGNYFLAYNNNLTRLNMPNVKKIGNNFLVSNKGLIQLNIPNERVIKSFFSISSTTRNLTQLAKIKVKNVGYSFFQAIQNALESGTTTDKTNEAKNVEQTELNQENSKKGVIKDD